MLNISLIKFIFVLIILNSFIFAQDPILQGLDNPDPEVRLNTLFEIQSQMLLQYGEELEWRMFEQPEPYIIDEYMRTLSGINYENNESIALNLIDFADKFPSMNPPGDPLRTRVFATYVLINQYENYSSIQYALEILNRDFPHVMPEAQIIMAKGLTVPEYFEESKDALISMINNCPDVMTRAYSLSALEDGIGSQSINIVTENFQNDEDQAIRFLCFKFLIELNYGNLNTLLKSRLSEEPFVGLRLNIADTLLSKFGEPSDVKAIRDYQPNEPEEAARRILDYHIYDFIPPRPEIPTTDMIQNLFQYIDELYQYEWIGEETHYQEYLGMVERIESSYQSGNLEDICRDLTTYLDYVEHNNYRPALTVEGYKFLHYHGTYIKENVENELGSCE